MFRRLRRRRTDSVRNDNYMRCVARERYGGLAQCYMIGAFFAIGIVGVNPHCIAQDLPPSQRWSLHGQATLVWQGYGRIRAPYTGENSLPAGGQNQASRLANELFRPDDFTIHDTATRATAMTSQRTIMWVGRRRG